MAITYQAVLVFQGTEAAFTTTNIPVAPIIEGSGSDSYEVDQSGPGFRQTTNKTGTRNGCRIPLLATENFTTHKYISFSLGSEEYGQTNNMETVANGGIRIIFVDSLGNYAGYNVWGSDIPDYDPGLANVEGWFNSFQSVTAAATPLAWYIDRTRTPDIASGTAVDWTDITNVEITIALAPGKTDQPDLFLRRLVKYDYYTITGTATLEDIYQQVVLDSNGASDIIQSGDKTRASFKDFSAAQRVYTTRTEFKIGDGVTATSFTDSAFALGVLNTWDQRASYRVIGPYVSLDDENTRTLEINQTATCTLSLTDGSIASAYNWQWKLIGSTSGTATCTRMSFYRSQKTSTVEGFLAGHGTYIDCTWEDCTDLTIDANTVITGGVYRNQTNANGKGLVITSSAGDYSSLDIRFNNNTNHDIELGSGGAGTYDLSGISVASGYTLKIHNDSTTNAITIKIPTGITYTTSSAGGSITVQTPATTYTLQLPNILDNSRVRIINETTSTELVNKLVSGGSGVNETFTEGTDYTAGDTGKYVITYQSGTTAKRCVSGIFNFPATTSTNSIPTIQEDDSVYNAIGLDGSLITEFASDFPNVEIDINDGDGTTTVQRLYSWYIHETTTATGILWCDGIIAQDQFNYVIITSIIDLVLENKNTTPLLLTGGLLTRDDDAVIFSTTGGSAFANPGKAFIANSDELNRNIINTQAIVISKK